MSPLLKNNELVLFSKIKNNYSRFDIIILKVNNKYYIKRIIGLEGETISYHNNELFVNGKKITENFNTTKVNDFNLTDICPYKIIPKDKLLVLGDNRQNSYDSRNFGLIDLTDVYGKVIFK